MKSRIPVAGLLLLSLSITASAASWWETGRQLLENASNAQSRVNETSGLSVEEIASGLKEALKIGTGNVVSRLGTTDGFLADQEIHIPLPGQIQQAKSLLETVGMGASLADLETRLNRAAEAATPKAKQLFLNAISEMTIDDARNIYNGSEDAATQYFRQKMSGPLGEEMRPVIAESLNQVGAVQLYDNIAGQYKTLPFVPDLKTDLTDYTIAKGMDGIFYYLAKEEAAIRQDPAKQTTALLKKLFGH
ncbi:MAG: DUF4197 domain-containing protein [Porticoccaceae bacterium]